MNVAWGGAALVGGAVLLGIAVASASFRAREDETLSPLVASALVGAAALFVVGLPVMYAQHAASAGTLGLAAHVLLTIGVLIFVLVSGGPLLFAAAPTTYGTSVVVVALALALAAGLVLTGVAILEANVYPSGAGYLLLASAAGFLFSFFIAELLPRVVGQIGTATLGVLLAASFAWIGIVMWSRAP